MTLTLNLDPSVEQYQQLAVAGWVRAPELDTVGTEGWALSDGRVWIGVTGSLPDPAAPAHPPYGVGSVGR